MQRAIISSTHSACRGASSSGAPPAANPAARSAGGIASIPSMICSPVSGVCQACAIGCQV